METAGDGASSTPEKTEGVGEASGSEVNSAEPSTGNAEQAAQDAVDAAANGEEVDWGALESILGKAGAEAAIDRILAKSPLKATVNGKEKPIRSLADLKMRGSFEFRANEKFEEAAKLRQEAEQTMEALKSGNIMSFLQLKGVDVTSKEAVDKFLSEQIDFLEADFGKTPEQRELEELRKKEEARKKAEEEAEMSKKEKEEAEVRAKQAEELFTVIDGACENSGIPSGPEVRQKVVEKMIEAADNEVVLEPQEALMVVLEEHYGQVEQFFNMLPIEQQLKFVSEDARKAILREATKDVKANDPFNSSEESVKQDKPRDKSQPEVKTISLNPFGGGFRKL